MTTVRAWASGLRPFVFPEQSAEDLLEQVGLLSQQIKEVVAVDTERRPGLCHCQSPRASPSGTCGAGQRRVHPHDVARFGP